MSRWMFELAEMHRRGELREVEQIYEDTRRGVMMKFNVKVVGNIALAAARVAIPQIAAVEEGIKAVGAAKAGNDKRKAVVGTVRSSVELAEALSGQEIIDEALFEEALNQINDGYVKLMKAIRTPEAQP